ncbi:hypothetical protein ACFFUO_02250, partial [Vibrio artabrorum]
NSGACLIRIFLVVIVHLVSDCTHLTQCPKLLVRIKKKYPLNIQQWINISAEDDFISHDSKIRNDFKDMLKLDLIPGGMKDIHPIYNLNIRNGKSNPHASIGYLINPKFITVLDEWLSS